MRLKENTRAITPNLFFPQDYFLKKFYFFELLKSLREGLMFSLIRDFFMTQFFAPYTGKKPKIVQINGHKLLIVSKEEEVFNHEALEELGADAVKKMRARGSDEDALIELAVKHKSGIVVASSDLDLNQILKGLHDELPWLH